jgi:hypothetical protein
MSFDVCPSLRYDALLPPSNGLPPSREFIVGNNPDSHSSVEGSHGASWNKHRPDGVADTFQVRNTTVEFHLDEPSNVFTQDDSGSCFFNNAEHFRPEVTVIFRAPALPGMTERLARKSTCDEIDSVEVSAVKVSDVGYKEGCAVTSFRLEQPPFCWASRSASSLLGAMLSIALGVGQSRPEVFSEDSLAVGFDFAEGNGVVSLSSGCEGEAPDA